MFSFLIFRLYVRDVCVIMNVYLLFFLLCIMSSLSLMMYIYICICFYLNSVLLVIKITSVFFHVIFT